MSETRINTDRVRFYSQRLSNISSRVDNLNWRLQALLVAAAQQGVPNTKRVDSLAGGKRSIRQCCSYLDATAYDFDSTERRIAGGPSAGLTRIASRILNNSVSAATENHSSFSWASIGTAVIPACIGTAKPSFEVFSQILPGRHTDTISSPDEPQRVVDRNYEELKTKYNPIVKNKSAISDRLGDKGFKQNEKNIHEVNSEDGWYEPKVAVAPLFFKKVSVEKAKYKVAYDGENYSYDLRFSSGEVHASVDAGLYVVDKNGKKVFSPMVNAEVGGSYAVFRSKYEYRTGNEGDFVRGQGSVDASAGYVEAKGVAKWNRKSKYIGASAEADLLKIDGKAGVTIGGVDVNVTGSLKVGVGFKAEAGYTDGKLKVKLGASLGLGVDIGFEVDVGAAVGKAKSFVNDVGKGISKGIGTGVKKLKRLFKW